MRVAVVGHVEWVEFARVERVPAAGEIVIASETWEQAGGGGAVAAAQLAKLAGGSLFLTALGDDELGHRAEIEVADQRVSVAAAFRREPQRRAFVFVDAAGERTITVIGEKLVPHGTDPLPWDELAAMDAVFFVSGDVAALAAARGARVLVATTRARDVLARANVKLDAVVGSGRDSAESYRPGDVEPPPELAVETNGAAGGSYAVAGGRDESFVAAPAPGPIGDAYGCGDSFAAGLTFGLAEGRSPDEALALAARCGAACLTGRGPYEGQLAVPL